jgi:hypothetical protein
MLNKRKVAKDSDHKLHEMGGKCRDCSARSLWHRQVYSSGVPQISHTGSVYTCVFQQCCLHKGNFITMRAAKSLWTAVALAMQP